MTKWTKETCVTKAQHFDTRTAWKISKDSGYQVARRNEWLDECTAHMSRPNIKWTKENCTQEALLFSTKTEWKVGSPGSYEAAYSKGWLEVCTMHMPTRALPGTLNKVACKEL